MNKKYKYIKINTIYAYQIIFPFSSINLERGVALASFKLISLHQNETRFSENAFSALETFIDIFYRISLINRSLWRFT